MALLPAGTIVPEEKSTDRLMLRPLLAAHVDLDYEAVMSSAAELRQWSQTEWPAEDFTLAENLADLERHQREHQEGVAYTYTVLDPHGARCLGCVYLTPLPAEVRDRLVISGSAAKVTFWVRTAERARDLDRHLLDTLLEWLAAEWSFASVAFVAAPGDGRQVALLSEALGNGAPVTLGDGRKCHAYRWERHSWPNQRKRSSE